MARRSESARLVALKTVLFDDAGAPALRNRVDIANHAAAQLHHDNLVPIFEARAYGSILVLVLEYVPGGDLSQRLQSGLPMVELVRLVRRMGEALDHAHNQGFMHLDIRPRNVLFRLDGSPVLTDFGNGWRIADGKPPSGYAATAGASGFMSPEQEAGREVDHRSDLYSLGAVFYGVLTGDAPQYADSGASSGEGHRSDGPSRLPTHLSALQPIVDKALARNPDKRYQRGADLATALEKVSGDPALAETTFKSDAVTVDEIQAVAGNLFTVPVDAVRQDLRLRHRRRILQRTFVTLLLVVLAGAGTVYLVNTQPLWFSALLAEAGLAENPLLQSAWLNAQSLHQDPNQSLSAIVAGYRRVLSMDDGHDGARAAVAGLAEQWRASILASLLQNDIAQAETRLGEMSSAFPEDAALGDLERQLANRKTAEALLASTQALLRSHGLSDIPSATAAIQAYHEIRRLAPGHAVAQQELDTLGRHYAALASEAAARGDVQGAISYLERATAANGNLPVLAAVRGEIQQATTAQAAIEQLLQQARDYRLEGLLVTPPGENAAELYNRVLATAPDNALARQGLSEVTSQLLSQAARMLEDDDFTAVRSLVDHASAAGVESAGLLEIKSRLDNRVAALATISGNLQEAAALLRRGFVTEPPEENAVLLLREVERLDPGNVRAAALLAQAAARLVEVARDAHAAGLDAQAKQYLELALTVTPDVPAWRALRESWE